jgi:hypothetical protein
MSEVFPGDSFSTEALQPVHLYRCDNAGRRLAHAQDNIQIAGHVHAHDLDGHPTPLVHTLRYVGKAPAFDFHRTFRTVRDVHGLWDYLMPAACFTKLVEQL